MTPSQFHSFGCIYFNGDQKWCLYIHLYIHVYIYIYIYIYINFRYWYIYIPNPSAHSRFNNKSVFKQSLTCLNLELSFSWPSCNTRVKESSLPYYLTIAGERIIGFMPYTCCFVGCCFEDLFHIVHDIHIQLALNKTHTHTHIYIYIYIYTCIVIL